MWQGDTARPLRLVRGFTDGYDPWLVLDGACLRRRSDEWDMVRGEPQFPCRSLGACTAVGPLGLAPRGLRLGRLAAQLKRTKAVTITPLGPPSFSPARRGRGWGDRDKDAPR